MNMDEQISTLSKENQMTISKIEKLCELDGKKMSDSDKEMLVRIATNQTTASQEVERLLSKYKKGGVN